MNVISFFFSRCLIFILVLISIGCTSFNLPKKVGELDEKITEISISSHNGLGGVGTKIFFKSDGNAKLICSYSGGSVDWKPFSSEGLCEKLFLQSNIPLEKKQTESNFSRVDTYSEKILPEDFEGIANLVLKNDFFSLKDEYTDGQIRTDSPPVITTVVSSKRTKKVVDYRSLGGQKLSEIEQAIFATAGKIKWTK